MMRFEGDNLYVLAGTVIDWGGNIRLDFVNAAVLPILRATGRYRNLSATWYAGTINPYVVIRVTSAIDRAQLADVLADIEGAIYQAGEMPQSVAMRVVSAPDSQGIAASAGNGGNVQGDVTATSTYWPTVLSGGVVPPTQASNSYFCGNGQTWSWSSLGCVPASSSEASENLLDYLARVLGVTPTQAALIGAAGALLVVVAVKKVL